jgi:nucleotide-binding universal stress UspA family protein
MAILAAVDGGTNSENVVKTGYDLSEAYNVELYVLHVLSESKFESQKEERPEYYRDEAEGDAEHVAQRVIEDTVGTADDVLAVGRVGTPAEEVLAFADDIDAQYLVTGGRRRSPVGKAVFGSDVQEILLKSKAPVVTVMGPTGKPE